MTVGELAELILAVCNSKSRIVYRDLPVDDPKVRRPDITKARKILGWEPQVQLEAGLATAFDYFKKKCSE